ncbi:MAG: AmmeMemoRadiSam system protein B [Candidatus Hydrogenedentes bacterium]|nr:AmmeMemoRadiSam system protein B [Candidatus Hydrogenedentota bacterium]
MIRFSLTLKLAVLFVAVAAWAWSPNSAAAEVIRWPAVAGRNYPAEPEVLLSTVRDFFEKADAPDVPSRLVAVVASAAPYPFAGQVSAHAFKALQPGQYERVIIIAPGHGPMFENCSIPALDIFLTPLGPVSVDAPALRYLLYSPMFHAHQLRYKAGKPEEQIHEYEFAIESLLPFLQERLQEFQLVPILVGDLRDPQGNVNKNTVRAIAETIQSIINERTLVVVATSFTHYGAQYGPLEFKENLEDNIARLDRQAFEHILSLDLDGFRSYLQDSRNVIDGKDCLQILFYLLPREAQARILAYDTSMAKTKDTKRSVSYASFVFHDPSKPALTAQPEKVRPLILRRPEKAAPREEGEGEAAAQEDAAAPEGEPDTPAAPVE